MNDFSEKRSFYRMAVNGPVKFRVNGDSKVSTGSVINLSSSGLLIASEEEVPVDSHMIVQIIPTQAITPPLTAEVEVVRVEPDSQFGNQIACRMVKLLADNEAGPEFS
ncbi:MAG: PilZ domain-containing protein [Candidatus Thiodiazotropha sp. 6PLUC2]